MSKIKNIIAREIKDSRQKPTVEVELETDKGKFIASCPAGKSTGKNEAAALPAEVAIENINTIIAPKLKGFDVREQQMIDTAMIQLDGTKNKAKLGANAILAVSLAICRAGAASKKMPLYQHIGELSNSNFQLSNLRMPFPMFNIINGGAHADNDLNIQEFMVVPQHKTFAENLVLGSTIFNTLTEALKENFGSLPLMGDEGGYAPKIAKAEQALYLLKNAIASHTEVKIALDCAASEFYKEGKYILEGREFSRHELVEFYQDLAARFPIISIEDPFEEEDWEGFKEIKNALPQTIIVGDDLTTTNIHQIKEAELKKACNGIIIKLNQIGSVSETLEAVKLAQSYGWKIIISHRSGETLDSFIADLAVGTQADFLKAGAYTKEERIVKYQRLLEIENELTPKK